MFKSSNFDKHLDMATSHLHLEPDWQSMMVICDSIRQADVTPKYAIQALKKKMFSANPHTAYYSLLALESIVKNCGIPIHEEISNKANCEMFVSLVNSTQHENVRAKMLELIQTWAYAFRQTEKYRSIRDTMNILKSEGRKFPELKEADAMFSSDIAPDWADGDVCNRCRVAFSMMQRKHHCRNCGQVFCHQCSAKTSTLPRFGIEKEVRVCDGCHVKLQKPILVKKPTEEDDLPAEYLTSSLAQQAQAPPRKTEEELREEEELQLALALSQSEAESKKANPASLYARRANTTAAIKPPSPEPMKHRSPSPVAVEEPPTDPELAKYLNRSYWEQRQAPEESPASPSAPSPMPSPMPQQQNIMFATNQKNSVADDPEIDEFAKVMKSQVEIFVNRMKSNSSRGRSISNDSSVQTLFMNITSMHSKLLTYIKEMDDKRMWYEQLQDKLAQVKDSRAALDVLRQEHQEKLRRIAEEQEMQRQMQMAHKLEIMRKKKQEYLQYQRQLALQRIQEQEREMQMRQEQQKAQYRMGTPGFPYNMPTGPQSHGSPIHGGQYGGQPQSFAYNPLMNSGQMPRFGMGPNMGGASQPGMPQPMPGMYVPGGPMPPQQQQSQQQQQPPQQFMGNSAINGQQAPNASGGVAAPGQLGPNNTLPGQMAGMMLSGGPPGSMPMPGQMPPQQQHMQGPGGHQQMPPGIDMGQQPQQQQHPQMQQPQGMQPPAPGPQQPQQTSPQQMPAMQPPQPQVQPVVSQPPPVANEVPAKSDPETAELISFD